MQPKAVRSFARGLAVLEALNQHGSATALTLARLTKIPRGTVYRLLQTLQDAGYVERDTANDRFCLRLTVRRLAEGFQEERWITQIARPSMSGLTQQISWPCDILTFEDLHMVIRDTTHPASPFSLDRNMVGRRIPMLSSAAGLAYLAYAPDQERAQILGLLTKANDSDQTRAFDPAAVMRAIEATRRRGFGLRQGGQIWPHTGAIALPICHHERIYACISVIWMSRVIDEREGVKLCLDRLRQTQHAIEQGLRTINAGEGRSG